LSTEKLSIQVSQGTGDGKVARDEVMHGLQGKNDGGIVVPRLVSTKRVARARGNLHETPGSLERTRKWGSPRRWKRKTVKVTKSRKGGGASKRQEGSKE